MEEHQLLLVSLVIAFVGVWMLIGALSLSEQIGKTRSRRLDADQPHAGLQGPHSRQQSQPPRKLSRSRSTSSAT